MIANTKKAIPETRIIDNSYDAEKIMGYHLHLFGGRDGLSIAVLDSYMNKFIAIEDYSFTPEKESDDFSSKISHIFDQDELLASFSFKQVIFCYTGNKSTFVPDPLFNLDRSEEYLSLNVKTLATENIHSDHLTMLGAHNVFAIPGILENTIREKFPQATIHHHATAFVESILLKNKNRDEIIATANVHLSGFELAVTCRNELIFYNSFSYDSSEDFLYFVLFTLEQLKLNPETIPFIFTGSAERSSALYITARKYLRFVGFGERTEHFSFAYGFEELPSHYHYILFNQHLCVL